MEKITYKTEDFEGPLDLLLMLITKNKINITDIKISDLLEQYLEYINIMRTQDMDIASEFLEMASRLVYIKSLYLLPKHEDVEILEKELKGELVSYQECKRMAEVLRKLVSFDSLVRDPEIVIFDMTYKKNHNVAELLDAYLRAKSNVKITTEVTNESFSQIVSKKIASVSSKVIYILKRVIKETELEYKSLFEKQSTKSDKIAVFLAVLELIKIKRLKIREPAGKTILGISDEFRRKRDIISKK